MAEEANRAPHWSDVLVERLRSGRGSAISGQRRGRDVEDFAEAIVRKVFGEDFQVRCTFAGPRGQEAKCDFAIPSKAAAAFIPQMLGHASLAATELYTHVSIRTLKQVHAATHPAAHLEKKKPSPQIESDDAAREELLATLEAESEDDDEKL